MTVRIPWRSWLVWMSILAGATLVLLYFNLGAEQEQAALTMLLVVLGGSVAGGRALGFTIAVISTMLINLFFQQPIGSLSITEPLDVVVLLAFLSTAFVTTDLLSRARQEATAAQARTSEVETLSRLGAETLRYASGGEALDAIATLVRSAIGADYCVILPFDRQLANTPAGAKAIAQLAADVQLTDAEHSLASLAQGGLPIILREPGVLVEHRSFDIAVPADETIRARLLSLPLRAEERTIGLLVVSANGGLLLDGAQRRLLAALGYYAALGLERMRLISEAAYSEALQEAQRAKEEVFAAVSHDLRTPLATIKLLAQPGADRGEHASRVIVEQADRLARLVGDLIDMSKFRTGSTLIQPELNTVDDLIGALLRQTEGTRNGRTIDVQLDFDSPALVGRFDFVHTLRAVGNLLDNALRHSPPDGTVEIRAERADRWLVISVADRGGGINSVERERIFQPFYRPAEATPDGGHAGLGLSIARSLAELQGGDVAYEDRPGGGSVFVLRLPAADVEDMSVAEAV